MGEEVLRRRLTRIVSILKGGKTKTSRRGSSIRHSRVKSYLVVSTRPGSRPGLRSWSRPGLGPQVSSEQTRQIQSPSKDPDPRSKVSLPPRVSHAWYRTFKWGRRGPSEEPHTLYDHRSMGGRPQECDFRSVGVAATVTDTDCGSGPCSPTGRVSGCPDSGVV